MSAMRMAVAAIAALRLAPSNSGRKTSSSALAIGYGLGEAYDDAGVWVTVGGVAVLAGLARMVGRRLLRPSR